MEERKNLTLLHGILVRGSKIVCAIWVDMRHLCEIILNLGQQFSVGNVALRFITVHICGFPIFHARHIVTTLGDSHFTETATVKSR